MEEANDWCELCMRAGAVRGAEALEGHEELLQAALKDVFPRVFGRHTRDSAPYESQRYDYAVEAVYRTCQDITAQWHLMLPPLMAFLEHSSPEVKHRGVRLLSVLLARIDSVFLKRNGTDKLFFDALERCIQYMSEELLPSAVRTYLQLADKMKLSYDSRELDERLVSLLDNAVAIPWQYKGGQPAFELAVANYLPAILSRLYVSTIVRFLPLLVTHPVTLMGEKEALQGDATSTATQLVTQSTSNLIMVLNKVAVTPRKRYWSKTIYAASVRCYYFVRDRELRLNLQTLISLVIEDIEPEELEKVKKSNVSDSLTKILA